MTDEKYYVVVSLLIAAIVVPSAILGAQTQVVNRALSQLTSKVASAPADEKVAEADVAYDEEEELPPFDTDDLTAAASINVIGRPTGPLYCPTSATKNEVVKFLAQYFVGRTPRTIKDYFPSFLAQFQREQDLKVQNSIRTFAGTVDPATLAKMQIVCKGAASPQGVKITEISPDIARRGYTVFVVGTGFTPSKNRLILNDRLVPYENLKSFNDGTRIRFQASMAPGTYELKIGTVFGISNVMKFTITGVTPTPTARPSISPSAHNAPILDRMISECGNFSIGCQVTVRGTGYTQAQYVVNFKSGASESKVTGYRLKNGKGDVVFNIPSDLKTNRTYDVWFTTDGGADSNIVKMLVKPEPL